MSDRRFPAGPSTWTAMRGLRAIRGGDLDGLPEFLAGVERRYGGIAHWRILGQHFFFVDDPGLIEELLVFRVADYRRGRGVQRLKRVLGNGLLSSEEPLHMRQRRLIQPAFHRDRIAGYGRSMVAAAAARVVGWAPGVPLDMRAEMADLTLGIAAQTLFGADVSGHSRTIRAALQTVMETFPASMSRFSEVLDALPMLPVTRRFLRARADLDGVIFGLIAARRAEPAAPRDDLLGMLLAARDDDGCAMDDAQVHDEAMTLFMAGHETTANALAWTWYLLARHPAASDRLARELDEVLAGRLPDPADVPRLRFTRDVFAEAMRLYPPAWVLGRRALRPTALGGQAIPADSVVIASQIVTHRNPRYWPHAAAFEPERWSTGEPPPRFAYFPFGGGSRRCIGESFAWMEGVLLIATIAQRFGFTTADPEPVGVEPLITLRPRTPIRLRTHARAPQPA